MFAVTCSFPYNHLYPWMSLLHILYLYISIQSPQSILYLHAISINASDSSDKDFLLILDDTQLNLSVISGLSFFTSCFSVFTHLLKLK